MTVVGGRGFGEVFDLQDGGPPEPRTSVPEGGVGAAPVARLLGAIFPFQFDRGRLGVAVGELIVVVVVVEGFYGRCFGTHCYCVLARLGVLG